MCVLNNHSPLAFSDFVSAPPLALSPSLLQPFLSWKLHTHSLPPVRKVVYRTCLYIFEYNIMYVSRIHVYSHNKHSYNTIFMAQFSSATAANRFFVPSIIFVHVTCFRTIISNLFRIRRFAIFKHHQTPHPSAQKSPFALNFSSLYVIKCYMQHIRTYQTNKR